MFLVNSFNNTEYADFIKHYKLENEQIMKCFISLSLYFISLFIYLYYAFYYIIMIDVPKLKRR
jgi:hypothetical protein